jgi:two-component system, OmpR family, sensor histidine kinase MprB
VTFRQRLMVASAAAVAVAVVTAWVVRWFVVRRELRAQVDTSLLARVPFLQGASPGEIPAGLGVGPGGPSFDFEVVSPNGEVIRPAGEPALGIAVGGDFGNRPTLRDINADDVHYRVLFAPIGQGFTVLLARPLTEVDDTLRRLVALMVLITGGGVGLAVALGMAVTRTAAAPVARLSNAAERVTETGDLSLRIEGSDSQDEIGRLAERFNAMMGALESSVTAQRQLVADASHELRTPLTSVRANIDLLASGRLTDPAERRRLLADVRVQLEALRILLIYTLASLSGGSPSRRTPEPELRRSRSEEAFAAAHDRPRMQDLAESLAEHPSDETFELGFWMASKPRRTSRLRFGFALRTRRLDSGRLRTGIAAR